jgi:hypothetical protein
MGRCLALLILLGLIAGMSPVSAKGGGPLHLFESQRKLVVRAGFPGLSPPSPSELLAGCGRGRYHDLAIHKC